MKKKEETIAAMRQIFSDEIDDTTKSALNQLRNADEQYFKKARAYNKKIFSNIIAAMDIPYPKAYAKITELAEKPAQDMEKKPYATLTAILLPALAKVYNLDIRCHLYPPVGPGEPSQPPRPDLHPSEKQG